MGDFSPIETQEQLNAIIGERIKEVKATAEKKYEGYVSPEDFKKSQEDFTRQIGDLNKALKESNEKYANHEKDIAERDKKIKDYETASMKTRIAHELDLSYDAVDFLKGEDEAAIRKSAESLKSLVGSRQAPPPLANPEGNIGNSDDAALRRTLKSLKGE